ncbi:MAG: alpha/beta fold hydrolase [Deltaproteobacteria bacterium]|jgi:triacylglycerol lipase
MLRRFAWVLLVFGCGGESSTLIAVDTPTDADVSLTSAPPATVQSLGAPYPIVLAHGMFGTDRFADVLEYWFRIPGHLEAQGEVVFVAEVDPLNDSTTRGLQLSAFVDEVLAETGHDRVVLIGHSQGGLDARVVASTYPNKVATVVTIATPHVGNELVDGSLGLLDNRFGALATDALAAVLGPFVYDRDEDLDVLAALNQVSTEGMDAFNRDYPDAAGVDYFSIAGRTDMVGSDHAACAAPAAPAFVSRWDDEDDPVSLAMRLSEDLADGNPIGSRPNVLPNDGLVTVDSARHGTFLGCIPADHLEQIGQLVGADPGCALIPPRCNDFAYLEFFAQLADWLRSEGY